MVVKASKVMGQVFGSLEEWELYCEIVVVQVSEEGLVCEFRAQLELDYEFEEVPV